MIAKQSMFEKLAPAEGHVFLKTEEYAPGQKITAVYLVTYVNAGKLRWTAEWIGTVEPRMEEGKVVFDIVLVATGERLTNEEFEAYRRKKWPMAHERGRNPDNTTLGVQGGAFAPGSKFTKGDRK